MKVNVKKLVSNERKKLQHPINILLDIHRPKISHIKETIQL